MTNIRVVIGSWISLPGEWKGKLLGRLVNVIEELITTHFRVPFDEYAVEKITKSFCEPIYYEIRLLERNAGIDSSARSHISAEGVIEKREEILVRIESSISRQKRFFDSFLAATTR